MRTNSTAESRTGLPLRLPHPAAAASSPLTSTFQPGLLGFTDKKKEEEEETASANPNHGSVDKVDVVVQLLPWSKCGLRRQVRAHGSTFVRAHLTGYLFGTQGNALLLLFI